MQIIYHRKRKTGLFRLSVIQASETLERGGNVGIMSIKEDDGAERMAKAIKDYSGIDVKIKRTTRKEPMENRRLVFDEFGEIIGTHILPQADVFSGWILSRNKV